MENIIQESEIINNTNTGMTFSFEEWIQNILTQTKENKTTPFMPENLMFLVNLRLTNRAQFEDLRDKLKELGVQHTRLDDALKQQEKTMSKSDEMEKKKITDTILGIALEDADYFHTPDKMAYADITMEDGHRETWSLQSKGFENWISQKCYKILRNIPSSDTIKSVTNVLTARAVMEGEERPVFIRTAAIDEKIYIDLGNCAWQSIEIDKNGYRIIDSPPVRFRRRNGMKELPLPKAAGDIHQLRNFLNVKDDNGFILIVSWLLMALRGHGPYPILAVVGEQGTAKSTLMFFLRQLVDPNTASLRTLPREVRDLFISANNALVLAFDNLSYMTDWTSDALCRLSTGGGFATRTLHTDDEEVLFDASRPILMNGIESVGTRGDLVDRSIILRLEPIPAENRKPSKELETEFEETRPYILGALLNMMVHGLNGIKTTKLTRHPRMSDFALWAAACETAVWPKGSFMKAYEMNSAESNEDVIAASVLATTVCAFMHEKRMEWEGISTKLLAELKDYVDNDKTLSDKRQWPQTAKALSEKLSRVAPALRKAGIEIERLRGKDNHRLIRLYRTSESINCAPPAPFTPEDIKTANNGVSLQTEANADKQKKASKFTRQPTKK